MPGKNLAEKGWFINYHSKSGNCNLFFLNCRAFYFK